MTETLTGDYLEAWATAALEGLQRHRAEINELNVFPIPDSDTGTNMATTMEYAVARVRDLDRTGGSVVAADVAAALASGAVAGARGNSGMVLSQILRAIADTAAMSATGNLSARAVPAMLSHAGELVLDALSDPVEGTIVTVLRAAAEGARTAAEAAGSAEAESPTGPATTLGMVVTGARDAAVDALEQTTGQLAELSEAGVVDAGGRGLVVILQALVDALRDEDRDDAGAGGDAADAPVPGTPGSHGSGEAPHLELVFGFRGDATQLRATLERLGDSVVVVSDAGSSDGVSHRAHVHTLRAGELIERVFALGDVHDLRLEVLPAAEAPEQTPASPVIALLPTRGAEGLASLFRRAGASVGDTTDTLTAALAAATGPVIVLTNGQDTTGLFTVLDQARRSGQADTAVTVVDTGSVVGGLAALAVYSPGADLEDNAEDMADAVHGQRWADVTDGGSDEVRTVVSDLLAGGGELVTVLHGDTVGQEDMDAVVADLAVTHPHAEIHAVHVPGLELVAQVGVE